MRTGARIAAVAAACWMAAAAGAGAGVGKGPVTGLDLPRYVSLKTGEANVRRGPGLNHRVDWVFLRRKMPLQIIAEYGHWRRVRDKDDATGWVHYSLLSGERTAVVTVERGALRQEARADAPPAAWLEQGVILSLDACGADWCEGDADGHDGWIEKSAIWGVDPEETFD